ncbi:MAG: polysaccharide deacetylase family protein [Propionibacteriaceae bacterium]|jgi:peptidoglycan/xylan/chitin deacetylase (PgdA/CDA1 family)
MESATLPGLAAFGLGDEMDGGFGIPDRRTFLAGALGTVGLLVAGCDKPSASDVTPSPADTAPSSLETTAMPSQTTTSATSTRPRPHQPAHNQQASASTIIKRATVPILCYHQLREWKSSDSEYNRVNLICPPRYFRAHLDALIDGGWTTISPDQYLAHLTKGGRLPKKPVILSFDDGSSGQVKEGLHQLVKRRMTGVFFVMTVVLGNSGWMSTRDIKRLADAGMTIGSHTWDHHAVTDLSGRDWRIQLDQSRAALRRASGQLVEHFAYPYGIVSTKAFSHLRHAGYKTGFQLEAKKLDHHAPLYTLRRSIVVSTWSGAALLKHLAKHRP